MSSKKSLQLRPIKETKESPEKQHHHHHHHISDLHGRLTGSLSSLSRTISKKNVQLDNAVSQYHSTTPSLTCRGRVVGLIRVVMTFFLLQSFLLGLAIAVAVELSIAFMVTKAQRQTTDHYEFEYRVLAWTVSAPWITLFFSMLMESAIQMALDSMQNSPRQGLNNHDMNSRFEFIYTVSGGEFPLLLHFRANICSILAAACVPKQSKHRRRQHLSTPKNGGATSTEEPMFPIPDWIVLTSEIMFLFGFIIVPVAYSIAGGGYYGVGRYKFYSIPQAYLTIMLLVSTIAVVMECSMNVVIFFWPRASRIRAFITAHSLAMFAFKPYVTDVSLLPIVSKLESGSGCCCCCCKTKRSGSGSDTSTNTSTDTSSTDLETSAANLRDNNQDESFQFTHPNFDSSKSIKGYNTTEQATSTSETSSPVLQTVRDFDHAQFAAISASNEVESSSTSETTAAAAAAAAAVATSLHKIMRRSYYNHVGPKRWHSIGSPADLLWSRLFSRLSVCQVCCRFCCVNREWDRKYDKNPSITTQSASENAGISQQTTLRTSSLRRQSSVVLDMQDDLLQHSSDFCANINYKWKSAFLLIIYLSMISLSLVSTMYVTVQFMMAFIILALGLLLRSNFPGLFGRLFFIVLGIQVGIQFVILILAYNESAGTFANQNVTFTGWSSNDGKIGWRKQHKHRMLPVCGTRWGENDLVSILDVGVMITGIYDTRDYGESAVLASFHGGPLEDVQLNVTVRQDEVVGDDGRKSDITWQRWDLARARTSVFVVRGTLTSYDFLQDIALYAFSTSIELVSFGLSLESFLPDHVLADIIDVVSNDDFEMNTYQSLREEIALFQREDGPHAKDQWTTIVAGHSLGGSYANILGALEEIPSVTFSPPGLQFISQSLKISQDQLELAKSYAMSFVPKHDVITKVDEIIGTKVEIPCTARLQSTIDIKDCHAPMRTLATLIMACPDMTHPTRKWSLAEDFYDQPVEKRVTWYLGGKDQKRDDVAWPYKWKRE